MRKVRDNRGFSLTEVLLAVGTLAIGMIFVGGTFLAGIHFSTIATERTLAAVTADEAVAKIKLYGINTTDPNLVLFENIVQNPPIDTNEFAYPSTPTNMAEKQYFWSALCRRAAPDPNRLVQIRIFVSRKVGSGTKYRNPDNPLDPAMAVDRPMPVKVGVSGNVNNNELTITENNKLNWINDGYTIVENTTGDIYRVVKRYAEQPYTILLNSPWNPQGTYPEPSYVWVIPPPFGSGRYSCIAVYPAETRF